MEEQSRTTGVIMPLRLLVRPEKRLKMSADTKSSHPRRHLVV